MVGGQERRRLDSQRLKHSGIGHNLLLVVSAEVGLAIGVLVGGPLLKPVIVDKYDVVDIRMYGIMMASSLVFGSVLVPLFGFLFGYIGAANARNRAIRDQKVTLLGAEHPVTRAVHGLSRELGLKVMPLVGTYRDAAINAFAAGANRGDAIVCFTEGALARCTSRELLAIAAHEVAHIANNDMHRIQLACSFQNALTWFFLIDEIRALVRWLLGSIGELLILKLSRKREFWADATAAALLGPEPMIEALKRLDSDQVEPPASKLAYARMMIRSHPKEWFSTHPSIDTRIAALASGEFLRRLPLRSDV